MKSLRVALLVSFAATAPALCFAQWQWIDKDGRKVYSDQSPPADIPAKNVLKQPGLRTSPAAMAAEPVAAAGSQPAKPAASAPKLSGKEKELEDKKKQAEAVEAEKKKASEEQVAKLRAENCERAKRSKASFDSGARIARTNAKGEKEYLDDATRASEAKRLEGIIANDCKVAQ